MVYWHAPRNPRLGGPRGTVVVVFYRRLFTHIWSAAFEETGLIVSLMSYCRSGIFKKDSTYYTSLCGTATAFVEWKKNGKGEEGKKGKERKV